jgi:hypothetical protein
MGECRNCGATELRELGTVGRIAPFFLKRVMGVEIRPVQSAEPLKRAIRRVVARGMGRLARFYSQQAFVEMQICRNCRFVQTCRPFHEEDVGKLYADYRSESYHRERTLYEPSYAAIASEVGYGSKEVQVRRLGLNKFLQASLSIGALQTLLDYGGSDGKFIPDLPCEKFVFDVSDLPPVPGVTRIMHETDLGRYSIVLVAHVLEHVVRPLQFVREVVKYLEPNGFLYVEVPQEILDGALGQLLLEEPKQDIGIHEHINYYSASAVRALFESSGLRLVAIESEPVDLGWVKSNLVRALGQSTKEAE